MALVTLRTLTRGDGLLGLRAAPGFGPRGAQLTVALVEGDVAAAVLASVGLAPLPVAALQWRDKRSAIDLAHAWTLPEEARWGDFFAEQVPRLAAQGVPVTLAPGFAHATAAAERWHFELQPLAQPKRQGSWLLSLGVEIDGERLDLVPMLARLMKHDARWLNAGELAAIDDDAVIVLHAPGGRRIEARAAPLKTIVANMLDLLAGPRHRGGQIVLDRWQAEHAEALRLELLGSMAARAGGHGAWALRGDAGLTELVQRLKAAGQPAAVAPPAGLSAHLRSYQLDGLAWLQTLRANGLAGILADEMGLGKTVQVLAHLLVEKEAGRLDRPALAVLPTTLLANWQAEAARHAPGLRVLPLQGPRRKREFPRIAEHDLVLTSYPLLARDLDALRRQPWHLLVLDEAQFAKNAATRAASAARRLDVRHKLAVTGTPVENHLGELWAQFDWLMPGFLGDARAFARRWRKPIEDNGETARAALLARRVAPFILRRRKADVAVELPPLTQVLRRVRLEGAQRELYESVRLLADEQVRRVLKQTSWRAAQIHVLDALLKLRQACCDPRLVPGHEAVTCSAKLDLLAEMLPALLGEGRRVLVFSQFTALLALVRERCAELPHALLTGAQPPRERTAAIARFQSRQVPLLLASLKAGGVGLNLTAADTVIHLDPWWNPAVQDQATARAHRIGQTEPVFVYRIVAEGSIEERMLALQERKAALAGAVLAEAQRPLARFSAADLAALLAPLADG